MAGAPMPKPGDVLAGKYRIERILGQGGMGTVALATQLAIDEPVAVKFLHASLAGDAELVLRFQREAKAARKIRSEHVVRILDVGTLETGAPYMVMEYLEGIDLDALLQRDGPQPISAAVDTLLQAMEALAEAHVQGMVHRDLKPANLFLAKRASGEPLVKVLDFGISKVTGSAGAELALTKTNTKTLGSPLYMAPEQMRSLKNVDARTDIWALGVILYELLAGKPPFDGESLTELTAMILQDAPRPLEAHRRDIPIGLAHVVGLALQKDPAMRPQDVAAFAAALAPYASLAGRISVDRIAAVLRQAGGAPGLTPRPSAPPIRISAPPRQNITTAAPQTLGLTVLAPAPPAPRRFVAIAVAVSTALLVGGLIFGAIVIYVVRMGHREDPPPAASAAPAETADEPSSAVATEKKKKDEPPTARVQIDPIGGTYAMPIDVALSSPSPRAAIFYTLDNSEPTASSQRYVKPFPITKQTNLRAIAVSPGHAASHTTLAIYTVGSMKLAAVPFVAFGDTACGLAPPPQAVPITNEGSTPLAFTVRMTRGEDSAFTVTADTTTLAPEKKTYLRLSAKALPHRVESLEGYADTIAIADSAGSPRNIAVRIHGVGQGFEVEDKGPIELDETRVSTSSAPVAIRVRNPSRNIPALLEATFENGKEHYAVTPPTLILEPEAEREFRVTFKPSGHGVHPGALRIAIQGGDGCSEPATIELRGTTRTTK